MWKQSVWKNLLPYQTEVYYLSCNCNPSCPNASQKNTGTFLYLDSLVPTQAPKAPPSPLYSMSGKIYSQYFPVILNQGLKISTWNCKECIKKRNELCTFSDIYRFRFIFQFKQLWCIVANHLFASTSILH